MLKRISGWVTFPGWSGCRQNVVEHVHAQILELSGERIDLLGRQSDRMVRRCRELVRGIRPGIRRALQRHQAERDPARRR